MTLTISIPDVTAQALSRQAKTLGISVDELMALIADQFLSDKGRAFDLTDEQMDEVRSSLEDPSPSITHETVMAEARRITSGQK